MNPDPTTDPGETVSNRRVANRTTKTVLLAVTAAGIVTLAALTYLLAKNGIS